MWFKPDPYNGAIWNVARCRSRYREVPYSGANLFTDQKVFFNVSKRELYLLTLGIPALTYKIY